MEGWSRAGWGVEGWEAEGSGVGLGRVWSRRDVLRGRNRPGG